MITYTLLLLALLSMLFFWSSRRSLRSITFLSEKLKGKVAFANATSDARPDIQWINDGIDMLLNNVEQLHASMRNQSELVRTELLAQWMPTVRRVQRATNIFRPRPNWPPVKLCFGRPSDRSLYGLLRTLRFPSRKLIKYAIRNISEEVIGTGSYAAEGLISAATISFWSLGPCIRRASTTTSS